MRMRASSSGTPDGLEEQRGEQRLLVAVDVQQAHGGPLVALGGRAVQAQARGPALGGRVARAQVLDPGAAAVGALDARDEARHDAP